MSDSNGGKTDRDWFLYTGIIVAVLSLLAVAGTSYYAATTLSQYGERYQQNTREIEREANENISQRCAFSAPETQKECVAKEAQAAQDKERNESDLYAQRQMAVWATGVGVAGFVSVLLSLAGIFFVLRTLGLNRDAVNAATAANKNTLKAIHFDNRPWLDFKTKVVSDFDGNDTDYYPKGVGVEVEVAIKNYGKSPALGVQVVVTPVLFGKWNIVEDYHLQGFRDVVFSEQQVGERNGYSVFPNETVCPVTRFVLTDEELLTSPRMARLDGVKDEVSLSTQFMLSVFYTSPTSPELLETSAPCTLYMPAGRGMLQHLRFRIGDAFRAIPQSKIRLKESYYKRAK